MVGNGQWFAGALALLLLGAADPPGGRSLRSSALALTPDGSRVVVANPDSGSVSIVDAATGQMLAEVPVGEVPQTVAADDRTAFVATRESLRVVDLQQLRTTRAFAAGNDLFGVIADERWVYVTASGSSEVVVLDRNTLEIVRRIATEPYPRGLATDPARRRLYVTHFRSGRLSVIDSEKLTVERVLSPGLDHNLSQSIVVAENRLYLPQTRSNASNQALLFDTTVFPVVAVFDATSGENLNRERISIDVVDRPVNMPLDAVSTAGGKLYVVNAGSDDVSVIDLATRRAVAHIDVGSNPRGIALAADERVAYVNNTLSGTVSLIDTSTDSVIATIRTTHIPLPPDILNGKILFHTSARTTLSKDRWISCATCHFDGGTDGRTWFFRDGPRSTPALFGIGETLPMHWSGDLDELQDVEDTIRTVQAGTGLATGESYCEPSCNVGLPNAGRSKELDDLAAFMRAVRAPAGRPIVDRDAAARGEMLFRDPRIGCATCHVAPLYTDRKKHDVGTGRGPHERKGTSFDTPSLRGVHDTAPYFHDGRTATLLDVVTAATGQHGNASGLNPGERHDLVEFLRSIPFPTSRRRAIAR